MAWKKEIYESLRRRPHTSRCISWPVYALALFWPAQWRVDRKVEQRHRIRQCRVQNRSLYIRCQCTQVDHAADVATINVFHLGDAGKIGYLATFNQSKPDAAWNTGAIEAFKEAVAGQGRPSGVKWADALSTSVRPVITYLFMALYCTAKGTAFFAALNGGAAWVEAVQVAWTGADQALWSGVLNFWFVGRVWDRAKS